MRFAGSEHGAAAECRGGWPWCSCAVLGTHVVVEGVAWPRDGVTRAWCAARCADGRLVRRRGGRWARCVVVRGRGHGFRGAGGPALSGARAGLARQEAKEAHDAAERHVGRGEQARRAPLRGVVLASILVRVASLLVPCILFYRGDDIMMMMMMIGYTRPGRYETCPALTASFKELLFHRLILLLPPLEGNKKQSMSKF